MRPSRLPLAAALAMLLAPGAQGEPSSLEQELILQGARAVQDEMLKVAENARPCSVTVLNQVRRGGNFITASGGSGVVIKSGGLVLTNEHVIAGADRLEVVTLEGRRFEATVENRVKGYDVALLQLKDPKGKPVRGLKAAVFASSAGIHPGRWVLATGNPFFLASSGRAVATLGVISGTDRVSPGEYLYGNALQHDAEINPGNSGGPLWDVQGRLLGLNGKISIRAAGSPSSSGVGFTIPIQQIQNFLPNLLEEGSTAVDPGDLGVLTETALDAKGAEAGARILQVRPGTAAEKARMRTGDVLLSITLKFKTHPLKTATDLTNFLALWPEGTRLDTVKARRDGKSLTFSGVVLGKRPEAPKP